MRNKWTRNSVFLNELSRLPFSCLAAKFLPSECRSSTGNTIYSQDIQSVEVIHAIHSLQSVVEWSSSRGSIISLENQSFLHNWVLSTAWSVTFAPNNHRIRIINLWGKMEIPSSAGDWLGLATDSSLRLFFPFRFDECYIWFCDFEECNNNDNDNEWRSVGNFPPSPLSNIYISCVECVRPGPVFSLARYPLYETDGNTKATIRSIHLSN